MSAQPLPKEEVFVAMRERIRTAGIVLPPEILRPIPGRHIHTIVGRVCDAEPLLKTERTLGQTMAEAVVKGLGAVGLLSAAQHLLLAVDDAAPHAQQALLRACRGSQIRIEPLTVRYPLDPWSLVADLFAAQDEGMRVESGMEEAINNSVVIDATTLCDVARALGGKWPFRRTITIAGEVREPGMLQVPLGTSVQQMVEACGGSSSLGWVVFHNGVLGGRLIEQTQVVEMETRGLVILPSRHPLVDRLSTPLGDEIRRLNSCCINCRICTDICPVHLNGGDLAPHKIMEALKMRGNPRLGAEIDSATLAVLDCLHCGVCRMGCPSRLRPDEAIRALATSLEQKGMVRNHAFPLRPRKGRLGRRVSVARIIEQLGLSGYNQGIGQPQRCYLPDRITVSLKMPNGEISVPTVRPGERVRAGDILALAPSGQVNELDRRAPVAGWVVEVDSSRGIILQTQ